VREPKIIMVGNDALNWDIQRLLNNVPLGIVLLDPSRRVVFYNQALEAIIGLPLSAARGLACHQVLRSRICLTGCPARDEGLSGRVCLESDLINRDRQLIPFRLTVSRLFDAQGEPAGFLETIEDLRLLKEYNEKISHAYRFGQLLGKSRQMEKLFTILPVIAQSDASVLITGETGTGKDILADALHQASARAKGPFIKINCGALPETLLESELFGHTKGAFTGALENKPGRFNLAHTGTLYLTEIGDLPLSLQVKLLTFLDDRIIYPLGGTTGIEADVRIIAATHRNLEQMVQEGHFRQDLFFRLNVLRAHIPALRDREGDIRLLLDHFLNQFNQKLGRSIAGFSSRALKILLGYPFPGNVRELRNIVEYAVNLCPDEKIVPKQLPSYLLEEKQTPAIAYRQETAPLFHPPGKSATWPEVEKELILEALVRAKGNRSRAAAALGFSRSTLWRKMRHYGIDTQ
jgi:two-component system, NtrC family, response regulator AtoC